MPGRGWQHGKNAPVERLAGESSQRRAGALPNANTSRLRLGDGGIEPYSANACDLRQRLTLSQCYSGTSIKRLDYAADRRGDGGCSIGSPAALDPGNHVF
jgi:hypothetical protein